ncbi:MAG: hypothetical protein LBS79_11680 [Tannerella sp.]|nr:hypothetical protein [Tannerella sp.]
MEEFSDWLYWIIIIIAGISSIIGSINKRNKQAAENRKPREIITEEWEDVFGDSNGRNVEIPQPASAERQQATIHDSHARSKSYFNYKTLDKKTGNSFLSGKDTENASLYTDDDNAAFTLEDLPANTEEWRKAFIYNEIFKRQY